MNGTNLALLLSALRARFALFALVLGVTFLVTMVVSLLMPKTYKATASLMVDMRDEQSLNAVLHPLMQGRETIGYMQTQMDVITSEKVARKVVQELKLTESPPLVAAFEKRTSRGTQSMVDWLVESLLEWIKVETTQSSVIRISFPAADPQYSAAVANAFAKAYIDTMLELRVEPTRQAAAWFDEQLKSLRAGLEDAQFKLTDYHRKQGIVSADERYDIENARLGELSAQAVRAQDQTFDLRARELQSRGYLERGGAPDRLPDVLANSFIQRLKADVLASEAKLQEMSTQYGANYPLYQRQQSEAQALRERLDSEMRKVVAGMESATRQSAGREAELRRALAQQRARVLDIKGDRNELTVLIRNVESAQRAYDTAMQRAVVSKVDSRASQTNVTLLSPAAVPLKPASPKLVLNAAISIVVGTMLGVGLVLLLELIDRRVRSRSDLENEWQVPVLGVLERWQPGGRLLPGPSGEFGRLPNPGRAWR